MAGISQFTGPSSSYAPRARDPAGYAVILPISMTGVADFGPHDTLVTRYVAIFEAALSSAHMLACLRINTPVAQNAARLATDLLGSALVGWVSHPLDD